MQDTARPTRLLHSHQVSTLKKNVGRFSSPMDIGTGSNIFDKVFPGWPTGVKSKAAKITFNNTPRKKVGDAVALRKIRSTRFLTPPQKETWSEFIGQLPESSPPSLISLSDLIMIDDEHGSGNVSGFEIVLSSNGDGVDEVHLGGGGHSYSDEKHFGGINDPRSRAFPGATGGEKDSGTTTPSTIASSLFESEADDDNADTIVDGGEDLGNYHSGRGFSNDGAASGLRICFQSENTDDKKNKPRGKSTKTIAFKQPKIGVTVVSPTILDFQSQNSSVPKGPQLINEFDDKVKAEIIKLSPLEQRSQDANFTAAFQAGSLPSVTSIFASLTSPCLWNGDTLCAAFEKDVTYLPSQLCLPGSGEIQSEGDMELDKEDTFALDFQSINALRSTFERGGGNPNGVNVIPEMSHADQVTRIDSDPPIEVEYMGTTAGTMLQVSQKEENDPSIIDRDQRKSYTSQVKSGACDVKMDAGPPLKDDPEFSKYFKMIKVGIPLGAVQHALINEGKDPDVINLDPNKPLSSQQQSKAEGAQMSFYKIRHEIGEPKLSENSLRDQATEQSSIQVVGVDIDNEEVASFTSPLTKTISAPPHGEASDESQPSSNQKVQLIDGRQRHVDQGKSYTSQVKSGACDVKMDAGPPLKDDPEFSKYFKMIKVGIPLGAVQHALLNEGKDPDVINLDPNKPLSRQQQSKAEGAQMSFYKIRHKIGEPKLSENSLRDQATEQSSIQVVGVDIDNVEVASFTSPLNKTISAPPQGEASDESQPSSNQKLQLIDGRRRMKSKMLKVGISKGPVMQALQKEKRHYFSQMLKIGISPGSVMQVFQKERRHYFNKTVKMGISPHLGRRALSRARLLPSVSCILASLTRTMHALSSVDLDKDEVASLFPSPLNYTPSAPPNEVASNAKKPIPKQNVQLINRRCGTVNEPKEFIAIHPIFINADRVEKIESNTPFEVEYAESCKMGMPTGKILQAMQTKGKDPSIIDLDQKKSYNVHDVKMDAGPPLKDDPEFSKYFKKGKDPNVINLEPDKPLSSQQQPKPKKAQMHSKFIGPKVARKRLHWTEIDESKLSENSFWNQAKINSSLQLVGLDFNEEEFASLFTAPLNETPLAPPNEEVSDEKKPAPKQKVQLIDSRRRMNGELLLNRLKVNNAVLARQVDRMEFIDAEGYELQGLMQLLPTKNETLVLRNYLPPHDASQSEYDESIAKLGECEQYMAVMLGVDDVKNKFQAMVFRAEFDDLVEKIRDGTNILIHACDCVKKSERFCKLLLYALKLGNALNSDGSNKEVTAITIGSLLKFPEAKALDHKTTMLHYLILILQKNDEDVLKLSEDFLPVKAAERVSMHVLDQQLREMEKGIESVKDVLTRHLIDHPLDETQMTQFSLSAESKIQSLIDGFTNAKMNFANLLQFFGEVKSMTSEEFFRAIDNFVSMFDRTHEELKRKEEAKLRKKRIEEKQWLREQEIAAKKIESIKLLELDRDTSNGRC